MAKARLSQNKGLPARWLYTHGAYYYQVPKDLRHLWGNKSKFRLGNTLADAYKAWGERTGIPESISTVGDLLDRYTREVVPTKAPKTIVDNLKQVVRIRAVFGTMPLQSVEPQHVYKYASLRGKQTAARREIALLSHAYTKSVEWGYMRRHPFKGEIRLAIGKPRKRYVSDDEIMEVLKVAPIRKKGSIRAVHAYIRLKLLTGLRRGDLLRLQQANMTKEGIEVTTSKTGKTVIYEWSELLRQAVADAMAARPTDNTSYLFCNKYGRSYINEQTGEASGWDSIWQRFMDRALSETRLKHRFTEHDLRAKAASDAGTLEHARALLSHADAGITRRVYRRKPERVKPLG